MTDKMKDEGLCDALSEVIAYPLSFISHPFLCALCVLGGSFLFRLLTFRS